MSFISVSSSDGVKFEVDRRVKHWSNKIKEMIDNPCIYGSGPYQVDIESEILQSILAWCYFQIQRTPRTSEQIPIIRKKTKKLKKAKTSKGAEESKDNENLVKDGPQTIIYGNDPWEKKFLDVGMMRLRMYMIGARRLGVQSLLRAVTLKFAKLLQNKNEDDIIDMFKVTKFNNEGKPLFNLLWDFNENNFISEKARDFFISYMNSSISCDITRGVCFTENIDYDSPDNNDGRLSVKSKGSQSKTTRKTGFK